MPRRTPPPPSTTDLAAVWLVAKNERKRFEDTEKELKKKLEEVVEAEGQEDDKGHVWLRLEHDVPGWEKGREVRFNALQRQRRVSTYMDEDAALKVLESRKLLDEEGVTTSYLEVSDAERAISVLREAGLLEEDSGFVVHTKVNEDRLHALYYERRISEQDFERIFTRSVSWALLPGRL